jgi:hypothetical protein
MPWTTRKATSWFMDCAMPHSAEPARKIEIATSQRSRRP